MARCPISAVDSRCVGCCRVWAVYSRRRCLIGWCCALQLMLFLGVLLRLPADRYWEDRKVFGPTYCCTSRHWQRCHMTSLWHQRLESVCGEVEWVIWMPQCVRRWSRFNAGNVSVVAAHRERQYWTPSLQSLETLSGCHTADDHFAIDTSASTHCSPRFVTLSVSSIITDPVFYLYPFVADVCHEMEPAWPIPYRYGLWLQAGIPTCQGNMANHHL